MSNLTTLIGSEILRILLALIDYASTPPPGIVSAICPSLHAFPEIRMIGIGYSGSTTVTPLGFNLLGKTAIKGIEPRFVILTVMVKALKKILDWWVFGLIADQNDGISFKKVFDEVGGPSLREVRTSKVCAAQHVGMTFGSRPHQSPVEICDSLDL